MKPHQKHLKRSSRSVISRSLISAISSAGFGWSLAAGLADSFFDSVDYLAVGSTSIPSASGLGLSVGTSPLNSPAVVGIFIPVISANKSPMMSALFSAESTPGPPPSYAPGPMRLSKELLMPETFPRNWLLPMPMPMLAMTGLMLV